MEVTAAHIAQLTHCAETVADLPFKVPFLAEVGDHQDAEVTADPDDPDGLSVLQPRDIGLCNSRLKATAAHTTSDIDAGRELRQQVRER